MGKRHQASRRKAYGRRQHELRERFERPHAGPDGIGVDVLDTHPYDDISDRVGSFDLAIATRIDFAFRD